MDLAALLRTFADLAPSKPPPIRNVRHYAPFVWRGAAADGSTLFPPRQVSGWASTDGEAGEPHDENFSTPAVPRSPELERLAAIDALHREERLLREGYGWLRGQIDERITLLPLIARPVRLDDDFELHPAGDREILPLVETADAAAELDRTFPLDDPVAEPEAALPEWVRAVLEAAGVVELPIEDGNPDPTSFRSDIDDPCVILGSALYLSRSPTSPDLDTALRSWSVTDGLERTALAAMYRSTDQTTPPAAPSSHETPITSPLPLSAAQRDVVRRARHDDMVVISGPPGSGKSHAVAAIAADAVANDRSVLIATQSVHAADVLAELLDRQPGPNPVVFGDQEHTKELATELAGGATSTLAADPRHLEHAVAALETRERHIEEEIAAALDAELLATHPTRSAARVSEWVTVAPGVFDADADLDALRALADTVAEDAATSQGWFGRWRARRRRSALFAAVRCGVDVALDDIDAAISASRSRRVAAGLTVSGGTALGALWDELERTGAELRTAFGSLLADRAISARGASKATTRAIAAVATALRQPRSVRRRLLAEIDGAALTRALPLWIGTLGDIEDLLPRTPGLFDLVVIDEASQVDQIRMAAALLRARRAVVAGDPRQLRHVSFLADVDVATTLDGHGLGAWTDRLDLRRVSGFDAAAAQTPVTFLDEHYRSVPHLIAFSAARFYPESIHLVTRHPSNESADAISLVAVDGQRDRSGVNAAEVTEVERQVRALAAAGWSSIGVLSPFRAQADAVEEMLLERFELEEITRLGLRVGTVHGFQGSERDVVVLSLGLGEGHSAASRRFVENAHLFNVMVTRACHHLVVVSSLDPAAHPPNEGTLGAFLHHAGAPPAPWPLFGADEAQRTPITDAEDDRPAVPRPPSRHSPRRATDGGGSRDAWNAAVATELVRLGMPVRVDYPVGRWTIDLVVGNADTAVAVETGVHPDGPAAHIERHRTLRAAGWTIVDAFPTRFARSAVDAALHLGHELGAEP